MLSEHSYTNYTPETIRKIYPSRKICSVPKCLNRSYRYTKTSLHRFPQNELRAEWGRILQVKTIPKNAYACSDHFTANDFACLNKGAGKVRRLKKTAIPSRNLPQDESSTDAEKKQNGSVYQLRGRKNVASALESMRTDSSANARPRANGQSGGGVKNIPTALAVGDRVRLVELRPVELRPVELRLRTCTDADVEQRGRRTPPTEHEADDAGNASLLPHVELKIDESTQTEAASSEAAAQTERRACGRATQTEAEFVGAPSSSALDMLRTDQKVRRFTGLPSTECLRRLRDTFARLEPRICGVAQPATLDTRLLLTLMKLKINCSFLCLSAIFGVSAARATAYFFQTLRTLHRFLKHLVAWPTERRRDRRQRPACFDRFPELRVVLDYVDFPVACCGCSACGLHCYSQYRKAHTLKAEIGVSPAGLVAHLGPVYGGRATDKWMFGRLGVLDKLRPGDGVMAVKNVFVHAECERKGVKLIQPGFGDGARFALAEDIYAIAQARVAAQRTVRRLKAYKILGDAVSWQMAPHFDEILGVVCGIANLSAPASADGEFEK